MVLPRIAVGFSLAAAMLFTFPSTGEAQQIGLAGLTVDLHDGQDLGRGCSWDENPSELGHSSCRLTRAWLREAGVPVVEDKEIDLSESLLGNERYRLAGRVTSISYLGTKSTAFNRFRPADPPREVYVDYEGEVVGQAPARSNDMWGRAAVRRPEVRVHVVWSLYDAQESVLVSERDVKGLYIDVAGDTRRTMADLADTAGAAIYDSLERFVDDVSNELDDN